MARTFIGQYFGDGSRAAFPLPSPLTVGHALYVELDGVECSEWTLTGTTLAFVEAPSVGSTVGVWSVTASGPAHITTRTSRRGGGALFSMIGDSRTADLQANGFSKDARNWFNWACAYYKQTPILVGAYGVSSKRTDEYLTNGNLEKAITDASGTVIFGYPAVNDIGQSDPGYTDTYGRSVTVANVAGYAVGNIVRAAMRVLAEGKRVVVLMEPGSTAATVAQAAATHEFNRLLRDALTGVKNFTLFNPCPLLWTYDANPAIAGRLSFKAGYLIDSQTHCGPLGARAVGKAFAAQVLPTLLPMCDTSVAHASDTVANGTSQLFPNPLFTNSGTGTATANITVSGAAIPASLGLGANTGGLLSCVVSVAANADGFGNDVTLAFTATGAVQGRVDFNIPNAAAWELTDSIQAGVDVDIAAGASNMALSHLLQLNAATSSGSISNDCYDMYSIGEGSWTNQAESMTLRSMRNTWSTSPAVTGKGYLLSRLLVIFNAAGTATITVRRASIYRYR